MPFDALRHGDKKWDVRRVRLVDFVDKQRADRLGGQPLERDHVFVVNQLTGLHHGMVIRADCLHIPAEQRALHAVEHVGNVVAKNARVLQQQLLQRLLVEQLFVLLCMIEKAYVLQHIGHADEGQHQDHHKIRQHLGKANVLVQKRCAGERLSKNEADNAHQAQRPQKIADRRGKMEPLQHRGCHPVQQGHQHHAGPHRALHDQGNRIGHVPHGGDGCRIKTIDKPGADQHIAGEGGEQQNQ